MRIMITYALPFRDDLGVKEEAYELGRDSATVAEVLDMIVRRHSSMRKFVDAGSDEAQRRHLAVAVNSRMAKLSDHVRDGDRIRLLLPVIGGSES